MASTPTRTYLSPESASDGHGAGVVTTLSIQEQSLMVSPVNVWEDH
jgi:hypothetical protein